MTGSDTGLVDQLESHRMMINQQAQAPQLTLAKPLRRPMVPSWKRIFDATAILVAAPFWVPLAALIALVIKGSSPGPVLFVQPRIGFRGRRFDCYKFRTMLLDADQNVHRRYARELMNSNRPMTKIDSIGDPRVIRFGNILRTSGLDELPQLINVLKGEMSLVGPRPCVPYEYDNYLPWHKHRLEGLPGLTGLWQVTGKNRTTFDEMVNLDITYLRQTSLWRDILIIAKTLPVVLLQLRTSRAK